MASEIKHSAEELEGEIYEMSQKQRKKQWVKNKRMPIPGMQYPSNRDSKNKSNNNKWRADNY